MLSLVLKEGREPFPLVETLCLRACPPSCRESVRIAKEATTVGPQRASPWLMMTGILTITR